MFKCWCPKVAWAADSRLLVSGSADSTLKLWSMETKKLHTDLPGHGDEVRAYLKSLESSICVNPIGMIWIVQPWCSGVHSGLESRWSASCIRKQRSLAEDLEEIGPPTNFFNSSLVIKKAKFRHHHHIFSRPCFQIWFSAKKKSGNAVLLQMVMDRPDKRFPTLKMISLEKPQLNKNT